MRRAVVLGSIVGAIGILEFYSGIDVPNYLRIPGLSNNIDYSTLLVRGAFNRPSSTAVDPIEFGVVMAMLVPFALHQAFYGAPMGRIRKWLPVLLILFAIPISVSRAGIVGLAVGLLFFVPTWKGQQRLGFLASCIVGPALLKVMAPGLLGTLFGYFTGMFGGSSRTLRQAGLMTTLATGLISFNAPSSGVRQSHFPAANLQLDLQHVPA